MKSRQETKALSRAEARRLNGRIRQQEFVARIKKNDQKIVRIRAYAIHETAIKSFAIAMRDAEDAKRMIFSSRKRGKK